MRGYFLERLLRTRLSVSAITGALKELTCGKKPRKEE